MRPLFGVFTPRARDNFSATIGGQIATNGRECAHVGHTEKYKRRLTQAGYYKNSMPVENGQSVDGAKTRRNALLRDICT